MLKKLLNKIGHHKKLCGDSIVEVMMSVTMLSTILISTFSILNQAIQTNVNVRNRIIALNIVREGFEAVRNIRDTNWLKYSGDRREKWLCLDTEGTPSACLGAGLNLITDGYYLVDYNSADQRYYLAPSSTTEDLDLTLPAQTGREAHQLFTDANNRYTHDPTDNTPTIFYRQIYLEVLNPYDATIPPTFCDGDDPTCNQARLHIVVRVQWLEENRVRNTLLEGDIFDFLERDEY